MPKNDRFRRALRGVWEHSHETYSEWPAGKRAAVQPAVAALLAWLADAESEGELIARYWVESNAPGLILRPLLPQAFDPEDALTVEEECFWRRITELEAGGDDA